ncbi:hypothetical protein [Bernardetia sp.]|uniref:hypothetical protein n=1 Tax=Bernardetia sp. TaxID=1937974 RepID=UPI0025BCF46F|nr:hypothetical protein [Bernardetia sp.]
MKLYHSLLIFTVLALLGSCKPYKDVSEKQQDNLLIQNSIQSDYAIENIYNIKRKTTLELNLEKGKRYKFQYFSKRYFDMLLLDSQSEIIAENKITYGDSSYRNKIIIFDCKNTGKYNLKFSGKYFPNSALLAVASQDLTSEIDEKYALIKNYTIYHRIYWTYPEVPTYTCIFSKGTKYKFSLEKGITNVKLYKGNSRKATTEFYLHPKENEVVFECKATGVYYLKAINYIKDEPSIIGLYFNRSDSLKTKK